MTFLHDERSAPGYLTVRSTSNHLSEYHPTALSPEALHLLNQTLDALLYATVQSAFSPSSSSPVSPGKTGGVQAGVGLSAQQFKAAFLRVVNNQRAKDALLEADLSLSFAGSPGLKPFILSSSTTATTAEATFVSLRAALTPLPVNSIVPPLASLPQYVRTTLSDFAERILRSLLQIIDREAVGKDHVGVDELRVLISEDEKGWAWIKETKVWREIQRGAVGGSRDSGDGWGNAKGRGSYEKGGTAMGRALSDDGNLGTSDFEELMTSGKTRMVSLTPNRLKQFEKTRAASILPSSVSAPSLSSLGAPAIPSSATSSMSGRRKLQARGARSEAAIDEDEEVLDPRDSDGGDTKRARPLKPRQSLIELLGSEPPWVESPPPPVPALAYGGSNGPMDSTRPRKGSIVTRALLARNGTDDRMIQSSRPMDSPSRMSVVSNGSYGSEQSDYGYPQPTGTDVPPLPNLASIDTYTRKTPRGFAPKDNREDLGRERQTTHDLVEFLTTPPPSPSPPTTAKFGSSQVYQAVPPISPPQTLSTKKSLGGLRGFVSFVSGRSFSATTNPVPTFPPSKDSVPAMGRRPSWTLGGTKSRSNGRRPQTSDGSISIRAHSKDEIRPATSSTPTFSNANPFGGSLPPTPEPQPYVALPRTSTPVVLPSFSKDTSSRRASFPTTYVSTSPIVLSPPTQLLRSPSSASAIDAPALKTATEYQSAQSEVSHSSKLSTQSVSEPAIVSRATKVTLAATAMTLAAVGGAVMSLEHHEAGKEVLEIIEPTQKSPVPAVDPTPATSAPILDDTPLSSIVLHSKDASTQVDEVHIDALEGLSTEMKDAKSVEACLALLRTFIDAQSKERFGVPAVEVQEEATEEEQEGMMVEFYLSGVDFPSPPKVEPTPVVVEESVETKGEVVESMEESEEESPMPGLFPQSVQHPIVV